MQPSFNMINRIVLLPFANVLTVSEKRATGGYIQVPSGQASFTMYWGCNYPGEPSNLSPLVTWAHQVPQRAVYLLQGTLLR